MLTVLLAGTLAQAAESGTNLEANNRAAKTACLSGDYAKGVALLAEGYVETNNPMYSFTQGRCFQQNGRYEEAVLRFREYQRKNIDAGGAPDAEAEKQIADCLALLEIQKSREAEEKAAAAAAAGDGTQVPPFAGTPVVQPGGGAGQVRPGGGAPAGSGGMPVQKKLGIAALGIGALGVGVGITAFFLGKSYLNTARDMGCTDQLCQGKAKDEYNKAQAAITVSNVGGIAGAVLLVGGIVLILTSPSSTPDAQSVALVPVVGPGTAQLALSGSF
jgi:tetratricopeptide (TPR) repeat protein